GILAALVRRAVTGRGCVVDASLYETGLAWLKGHHASFSTSGIVPERHRTGSHRVVPFESFETSTGPIIVAAGNDRLFAKLATARARTSTARHPRRVSTPTRCAASGAEEARARAEPARPRPALLVAVIWGLAFVATRIGLDDLTPPQLAAARFLIAAFPVVVLARPRVAWPALIAVGLTLFAGQFILQFFGIAGGMPPGLASIVVQTQALFT